MRLNREQVSEIILNKNNLVYGLLVFVFITIVLFITFGKGTYSVDEGTGTDVLTIICPESALKGETIECSMELNSLTMQTYGMSAKYNIPDGMEFVEIVSDTWKVTTSDQDGAVLINLSGVTDKDSVGIARFVMPTDAKSNDIYKLELFDITIGDGEDTVVELSNVSDEIRIKSDINTLDSITLSNSVLNEEFVKENNEYTALIDSDKTVISVVKTDERATVVGNGEVDIHYGTNNIDIIVTSESGIQNTYKLEIYREYKFNSDIYKYSEEDKYIYTGTDTDSNVILANVNLNDGLSRKIENNKLIISYGTEVLKEYKLINVSSTVYDLSKDYIYVGTDGLDLSKISVVNGEREVTDNKLVIKFGSEVLQEYKLISVSSSVYDLSKDYIYVGTDELDLSKISVINGSREILNNKLLIKYGNDVLKEYVLISISSSMYDLSKDYIYVGIDGLDLSKISVVNGSREILNNKLLIKYGNEVLQEYNLISISSSVYDLSKDYIYVGTEELDSSKISVVNGSRKIENNKLIISYGTEVLKEIDILSIKFGIMNVKDKIISLDNNMPYDTFVNSVTVSGLTYGIFNGDESITTGTIEHGIVLKVYYNNIELDSYTISVYNFKFSDDVTIDDVNKYIKYLTIGTEVSKFLEDSFTTNCDAYLYDKTGNKKDSDDVIKTGDVLKVYFGTDLMEEYTLSVIGDSNGDGRFSILDVAQLRKHLVKWENVTTGQIFEMKGVYKDAFDFNKDGNISIVDLAIMRKKIVGLI